MTYAPHESLAAGQIIDCEPKSGAVVEAGASVALTVAKKVDPTKEIPKLKGMSCSKAQKVIVEEGFKVGKVNWRSYDAPPFLVMGQFRTPAPRSRPAPKSTSAAPRTIDLPSAESSRPHTTTPWEILPLGLDLDAAQVGAKAARLGQALAAGLPVPPGFVIPVRAQEPLSQALLEEEEDPERFAVLDRTISNALDALSPPPWVVRTSSPKRTAPRSPSPERT